MRISESLTQMSKIVKYGKKLKLKNQT